MRYPFFQFLLAVSLLLQGGNIRACQVRSILTGVSEKSVAVDVSLCDSTGMPTSADAEDDQDTKSGHDQKACPCEFRKGLAQPERLTMDLSIPLCPTVPLPDFLDSDRFSVFVTRPANPILADFKLQSPPLLI